MIEEMRGNVMDLQGDGWKVLAGSCLDRLPELADESVDAVVCDPPYELGFMGKSWDSSGIAYDVNVWKECLRVLKPGGHVLAFGGSRTWHRLAVAVEDAGFELRDSIAWLYGSGFPKSLDVSKAIDKQRNDNQESVVVAEYLLRHNSFDTVSAFREHLNFHILGKRHSGGSAQEWTTTDLTTKTLKRCPTWEQWLQLKELLKLDDSMDAEVWRLNGRKGQPGEAWSEREVIGQREVPEGHSFASERFGNTSNSKEIDVTAPATDEAKQWAGWGTALKPAFEPVVVGRKPLKGTVAANVLAYGVGGLNIDGTRIQTSDKLYRASSIAKPENQKQNTGWQRPWKADAEKVAEANLRVQQKSAHADALGRWPSNVILDEYTAQLVDQQSGFSKSSGVINRWTDGAKPFGNGAGGAYESVQGVADSGGASRFFYIAKANKRDRNEGLDELEEASASVMVDREEGSAGMNSPRAGAGRTSGAKNFHPTVKPTDLMRQLIRLVTPPGGVVLDPFTGSGSTGKAAILEGMQFIGCELTPDYLPIIEGRIEWAVEQVKADKLKAEQESAEVLF